jgi:hypothetical protein
MRFGNAQSVKGRCDDEEAEEESGRFYIPPKGRAIIVATLGFLRSTLLIL